MNYLIIALGGALGAMARYWVYNALPDWKDSGFPYGTFAVNVVGSLLLGLVFVMLVERSVFAPGMSEQLRGLMGVGFLGAFTTFSTFSLDALSLLQSGAFGMALVYILGSVLICLLAAWFGLVLGRLVF